jgi:hypothetical protein
MISLNDSANSSIGSPAQLAIEKEKYRDLLDQNRKLMEDAARKYEEERKRTPIQQQLNHEHGKDDHDHPKEERDKAEEQIKDKGGPVQVHAPIDNNPNAPGKCPKNEYS